MREIELLELPNCKPANQGIQASLIVGHSDGQLVRPPNVCNNCHPNVAIFDHCLHHLLGVGSFSLVLPPNSHRLMYIIAGMPTTLAWMLAVHAISPTHVNNAPSLRVGFIAIANNQSRFSPFKCRATLPVQPLAEVVLVGVCLNGRVLLPLYLLQLGRTLGQQHLNHLAYVYAWVVACAGTLGLSANLKQSA
ncbi:hypothetical protein GQ44DRAFT_209056 [Phaeosphaeriaceae sp. PMI808]|nr:hypothetical protein GQ44DRAFT_209056 [Phaeosphaeriaceae sp. PMI808]